MGEFTVSKIIDGDTFEVEQGWKWHDKQGDTIRPTGYDTPERRKPSYQEAKQKLSDLILNKKVDIKNYRTVDKWGRLVADVFYQDKNLADYFPEYKS